MAAVTSFGDWIRQQRKALKLTQAALAEQVGCAVVTIKKIEQELRRPSAEMAELLADHLAISSTDRPKFLAMARGQMLEASPAVKTIALPPFLQNPERPVARFVPRSAELDHLQNQLQQALTGQVQLCFIRGEAGRGKTSLMQAFAQQAQIANPDLIVAGGMCSAHVGQGDPFLPIRDLFDLLTGDVEAHWQAQTLALDQARRLWRFMPAVAQTLLDEGEDLFGILISPNALYNRLNTYSSTHFRGLDRLRQISQQPSPPRLDQTQAQLFEQITRVFAILSRAKPLLLLLDDLQWIDETSLALLFHLSRRLMGQRVMIVGTYRGNEITDTHPLRTTLTELIRRFGDIELDLEGNDVQQDRLFFEALVDQEAPQLDDDFRAQLFDLTDGHPLFTVELLRHLQNKRYLVRDEQGTWVQKQPIQFETLPARIDAVISQRIHQLEPKLQEILRVASVEGEQFTAQVVAATLDIDERTLLSQLTHLAQQHGIVQEYNYERVDQRYVSRYQFRHALFPQYLYNSLGQGERRLLHHATAQHLEQLVGRQLEQFAVTLAYHYGEADDTSNMAKYHQIAGDQSRLASALSEAMTHYETALTGWPPDDLAGRADVLCKLADCLRTVGRQVDALPLLNEANRLFTNLDNPLRTGETLRLTGRLYWELGEGKTGLDYYQRALTLLETCPESVELAETMSAMGRMHMLASENEQAVQWCQRAIDLAERLGAESVVVHANNALGPSLVLLSQVNQGLALLRQNIKQAKALKLNYEVCCGYVNLDSMLVTRGQYDERPALLNEFLSYAHEIHARHYIGTALTLLSENAWHIGQWRQALQHHQELQAWDKDYPLVPVVKLSADALSGLIYNDLNQPERAYQILAQELERARDIDELLLTLPILSQMARATAALGRPQETVGLIKEVINLVDRTPTGELSDLLLIPHHWLLNQSNGNGQRLADKIQGYLERFDQMTEIPLTNTILREAQGTAALHAQDIDKALFCFEQAAAGWHSLNRPYDQLRALRFLAQTLQQAGEGQKSEDILEQAQGLVEMLAAQIDDPNLQDSFLNQ